MSQEPTPRRAARGACPVEVPSCEDVVLRLREMASPEVVEGMARFGIPSEGALGVRVGALRALAKELGRHHALAEDLWRTDLYEGRMLACFVEDPACVDFAQMDRWAADFDSWALCDTACFHLFDKTPHAFGRVQAWAERPEEFVRRGAFALLASLALHGKKLPDEAFAPGLALIEAADDDRNFVKKAVSWALRGIGNRKSPALKESALAVAERLAASPSAARRWVGKDALREMRVSPS